MNLTNLREIMKPNMRILLERYYKEERTLEEIGKEFGVTRERVRQWMEGYGLPRDPKRTSKRILWNRKNNRRRLWNGKKFEWDKIK